MKLSAVPKNDPIERISIGMHASVISRITAYQAYYEEVYKDQLSQGRLIEEMLKTFMEGDKDFQKRLSDPAFVKKVEAAKKTAE